jgi:glycosyltransferase involved in cell wall biosynthesis
MHRFHRAARKALILSPTASHPQDYGNRNRVYQTTSFFKQQGYEIHFVLYPVEPDWRKGVPKSARAMRTEWESFAIVPTTRPVQPPAIAEYHLIDEWWDPSIEAYLKWLFEHEFFDVFVVNYAFLSKAFELAPKATAKILETHDRFSGRKELLASLGAPLEAFYTTEDQEMIALDRSDIVVAIKDSEARFYQGLTTRPVISVPFWPERHFQRALQSAANTSDVLRAGFVGALNVVNVSNMVRFLDSFQRQCASEPTLVTLDVAGEVCSQLSAMASEVRLLGRVDDLDHFYDMLDVVVAPMMYSTGLKIKVAEALSHGKAVVATANGFDGFTPTDEYHTLESIEDVTSALVRLSRDPDRLEQLRSNSDSAARLAREQSEAAYAELMRCVNRLSGTTVLLTDRAVGAQDDLLALRLKQWAELCSQITPTVVVSIGAQESSAGVNGLQGVDIAEVADGPDVVANVRSLLGEIEQSSMIVEVILSVSGENGDRLWNSLKDRYHVTLDTWLPGLAKLSSPHAPPPISSDMWLTAADRPGGGLYLSTTAIRELPTKLRVWKGARARGVLLVRCGVGENDEAGIELLLARSTERDPVQVVTLSSSGSAELNRGFLDALVECGKPAVLLAIGDDRRGLAVCRSISLLAAVPCIGISSAQLPVIVKRNDGRIRLCWTYRDIAGHIGNTEELSRAVSHHHEGSGWMSYSRLLANRARRSGSGMGHASPLPLNEILLRGIQHSLARLVG